MTEASSSATLGERLALLLNKVSPESEVKVVGLRRLSGGASRETWAFDAVSDGRSEALVLRRDPPTEPRPDMMLSEAVAFREATRVGVPEPEILLADADPTALGSAFILMRHVDGETIARKILRDPALAAVRPRLAAQCGEILARIHSMDIDALPDLAEGDPLAELTAALDLLGWPSPALELALRWLSQNPPASTGRVVVHGDFRLGNLIIGPDGVQAVLDWELLHIGDPMEDLGWMCVRAWRFGSPLPVGGFGSYDDFFAGYEQVAGTPVDPDVVRWWEVLGTVRWGVICMSQAQRHLSGITRSVELAAVGRRVCEQEHDVLLLLRDRLGGDVA